MIWELQVEIREGKRARRERLALKRQHLTLEELIRRRQDELDRDPWRSRLRYFHSPEHALQAFHDARYLVILDGRRLMDLAEQITLTPLSKLVFWHVSLM